VPDPIYKGKPLSYWLGGYAPYTMGGTNAPPPGITREEACEAVQNLGTNALPLLLQILREPDHPLKERLLSMAAKQHFIKIHLPTPSFIRKHRALQALSNLGTNALPAIPELMEIYERHPSLLSQQIVPGILSGIGPPAEMAIPMLIRGTSHTNAFVRQNAILALGSIHARPELVVPVLIKCLQDPFPDAQVNAAYSLAKFGSVARQAAPDLLQLLLVEQAKTPSATNGPSISRSISHSTGSWTVGEGSSFPSNADVAGAVGDALKAIDPEAAAKAGIK
jgi:HEAT repeat protein